MMKVTLGQDSEYNAVEYQYGKGLLKQKHPILKMFLEKEIRSKTQIIENLKGQQGEHIAVRIEELRAELCMCREALGLVE